MLSLVYSHLQGAVVTSNERLLLALSEFIADRKEGLKAGAYEIEISNVDDGVILDLDSFGISVSGEGKFKINIDLVYRKTK
jgi:hypothetical protein